MDDTRILVVEDDADINEVVCERLGRDGYACVSAYSGSEARPRVCRRGGVRGRPPCGGLRAAASDGGHTVLAIGRWSLDIDVHTFRIDDEPVSLTNIEFAIVELLMGHPDTVFSKRQVYELCWGEPYMVDDNTVTAHISKIRAKLRASGTDGYIRTVWGLGVKLAVPR